MILVCGERIECAWSISCKPQNGRTAVYVGMYLRMGQKPASSRGFDYVWDNAMRTREKRRQREREEKRRT